MAQEKKQQEQVLSDDLKKGFQAASELKYRKQAIFFLNAMWREHQEQAENVWNCVQAMAEMDKDKGEEGSDLDEFTAHQFLERFDEPLTVLKFRAAFKEIDFDQNKRMGLLEYLIYKYKVNIATLMTRPQGINKEIEKAESALQKVLDEIAKIEKQKNELSKKAEKKGVIGRAAYNELEQIKSQDSMPVTRALLTAQAALRKAKRTKGDLSAQGKLWFIEREIAEAAEYKPKANWKKNAW